LPQRQDPGVLLGIASEKKQSGCHDRTREAWSAEAMLQLSKAGDSLPHSRGPPPTTSLPGGGITSRCSISSARFNSRGFQKYACETQPTARPAMIPCAHHGRVPALSRHGPLATVFRRWYPSRGAHSRQPASAGLLDQRIHPKIRDPIYETQHLAHLPQFGWFWEKIWGYFVRKALEMNAGFSPNGV
jgi:hypothetical protein